MRYFELSAAVKKGCVFGQVDRDDGHKGMVILHQFSIIAGAHPPHLVVKGGDPSAPSRAAVPLAPISSPIKEGVRARHECCSSCQNVRS